ncbi:hypothetical protein THMIRHAS_01170 [Thiosulfatimonas sediminis]|uniref:Uncharacterized protein n=1 Tax=Thiosulfatimonas sediminis TaxID=2675054 RepID=A0A6F8PRT0_9GAMM|nr:hypothetical protein [Thiosulfatimonas sediminis]BBP44744.1 hypothetical protein THMIRHAS_01170 [Thiosulfatimonas sediminis]
MATELLLNNVLGDKLFGDINTFDSTDDSTRMDTAMLGLIGILNTKAGFGYKGATAGDGTTNVNDFVKLMTKTLPFGDAIFYFNNQFSPSNELLNQGVAIIKSLPFAQDVILPMLSPAATQDEFGGDALGAGVGHLKSFPTLEPIVSEVIVNLHNDPLLGDQVSIATAFLHDFSFLGNLIGGTIPAGNALSSNDGTGHDTLDVMVAFAKKIPVAGDVVDTIIPDVFPNALGGDVQAFAGLLHDVIPGYTTADALIGNDGFFTNLMAGDLNADKLFEVVDIIVDAAPDELGGLLGGSGVLSVASLGGSGSGSADAGILGIINLGSNSALSLDSLTLLG